MGDLIAGEDQKHLPGMEMLCALGGKDLSLSGGNIVQKSIIHRFRLTFISGRGK